MKTKKKITIECKDITQKQFSNLIIELNLICKQWRPYAQLELKAPNIKKIIKLGTTKPKSVHSLELL
jgi:hypothetical protein